MNHPERRAQLSRFLKNCRARISPSDVGFSEQAERRRTRGLRREEVSALAGVSVTWYTWLEQGRNIRTSQEVLEGLARTLQMSDVERAYLFELVQHRPPPLTAVSNDEIDPSVERMIAALPLPCLVTNIRWDVLSWNDLAAGTFGDFAEIPRKDRNILKFLFTNPDYREDSEEFERLACRWLSKVRVDYGRSGGDPAFEALIGELSDLCPVFRKIWAESSAIERNEGVNQFPGATVGELTLEHTSYLIEGSPSQRLILFTPCNAGSASMLARLRKRTPRRERST